jgi:hypothetical protein
MVARDGRSAGSRRRIVVASIAAGSVALATAAAFVTPAGAVPDQDPDDTTNTSVVVLPEGRQEDGARELNVLPTGQQAVSEGEQGEPNPEAPEVTLATRGTPTQGDGGNPDEPLVTLAGGSQDTAAPTPG